MITAHYPIATLAALKLPGYPETDPEWRDLVEREKWECIEVKSRGCGEITPHFAPPERVAKLIAQRDEGQLDGAGVKNKANLRYMTQEEKLERIKQIFKEAGGAKPTIKLEMNLSVRQAKAVFDALAALNEKTHDE